ncbi:hypothetical protein Pmani_033151 [Petrolisthes manimaculis]|uniref:Uncharacterized protein n=1 Tax=Petrolisthes manimaculis TaxID=1843537 RepID=A0AAE1NSD4_9EUCA|nr:hypothetical protein Pmani_033151 [Petrolisthes manimaculis]
MLQRDVPCVVGCSSGGGGCVVVSGQTEARYLPTRADDSGITQMKDLIKQLQETLREIVAISGSTNSDMGPRMSSYDKRYLYKRSATSSSSLPAEGDAEVPQPLLNLPQ